MKVTQATSVHGSKTELPLNLIIDVLIFCYITSIHIMSYSVELNMFSKGLAFVLMAFLGVYMFSKRKMIVSGFLQFFLAFILICFISMFWAKNVDYSISVVLTLLQIFVLCFLLYDYVIRENKLDYLIVVIAISGTIMAVYTVLFVGVTEYFTQMTEEGLRIGSEVTNVNVIGYTTSTAGLISLWKALYEKKNWYYLLMVIDIVVALGTGSRKVFICLVLGLLFIFMMQGERKKRFKYILIAICAILVFIAVLQLPFFVTIRTRVDETIRVIFFGEKIAEADTSTREAMIKIGIQQFLETPFTGVGINNTNYLTRIATGHSTYLHNNYVELLASIGIFGTIAFYLMFIPPLFGVIKPAFKGNKYAALAFALMCIDLVLHYAMVVYYSKTTYISIILYWVVFEKLRRTQNEKTLEGC